MLSVAFEARITDGVITIPVEYRPRFHDRAMVILLREDEPSTEKGDIIEELLSHPIRLKDFRPYSRDEIYDR